MKGLEDRIKRRIQERKELNEALRDCIIGDVFTARYTNEEVTVVKKTKGGHITMRYESGREMIITPNMYSG